MIELYCYTVDDKGSFCIKNFNLLEEFYIDRWVKVDRLSEQDILILKYE